MRIGFDAKRAFYNRSGLGNYSRDTLRALSRFYPDNEFFLYTPSEYNPLSFELAANQQMHVPKGSTGKIAGAYWRTYKLAKEIGSDSLDIFHGLSNELPRKINTSGVRSVVTIHDLIFLRFPHWYPFIDRKIYTAKFKHASKVADRIVAISEQTRNDIVEFFGISPHKTDVVYQSCNDAFKSQISDSEKQIAKEKFNLPDEFLLYVGTIEERKNLLNILVAMHEAGINIPLVIIGRKTDYYNKVQYYISEKGISNILFLTDLTVTDLPAIYQQAKIFIYPSIFEGFGIPIIEALYSKVPVITSKGSCFSEAGGNSSVYIDPTSPGEIAEAIQYLNKKPDVRAEMIELGYKYVQKFSADNLASGLMDTYKKVLDER